MKKIFKTLGQVAKGVGKALIHDVLPIPDIKEISKKVNRKSIAETVRSEGYVASNNASMIADLLDDGKINQSVDDVFIQTVSRLIAGTSSFLAIIIYLLTVIF